MNYKILGLLVVGMLAGPVVADAQEEVYDYTGNIMTGPAGVSYSFDATMTVFYEGAPIFFSVDILNSHGNILESFNDGVCTTACTMDGNLSGVYYTVNGQPNVSAFDNPGVFQGSIAFVDGSTYVDITPAGDSLGSCALIGPSTLCSVEISNTSPGVWTSAPEISLNGTASAFTLLGCCLQILLSKFRADGRKPG
jgi:hypothetical protein